MKCTNCSNCKPTMVFMDGSRTIGCERNPKFEEMNKKIHLIEGEESKELEKDCSLYREI